ncbi:MAG: AI-2E family transporter [Tepidisphaeraceae bacterium]
MVFTVFMLLDRQDLRDRAIRLVSRGKYTVTTKALDDAGTRISRYMLAQTIVNGSYGFVVALGLYVIGLTLGGKAFPSFVLWGLLAAVLRFIPYAGPVTAAAFPLTLSLVVYPGFTVFVAVGVMLILIELISNNVMEPWLYGSSTGLSTMAILVAAVFWTWLWGPIGLFMSTPLTVCIVVLGKHVRQLGFLDVLLGDQPALPPGVRFYQRLLAGDANEAEIVLNHHAKHEGGHRVPDEVLIPALLMARRDQRDGDLSAEEEATLMTTAEKLLEKRAEDCSERTQLARQKSEAGPAAVPEPCPQRVIGCPAHHRSEELALEALNQLGLPDAFCMDVLSSRLLHGQIEEKIRDVQPAVIYVAIVPPGGTPQAQYLCRRLHRAFPNIPIVVGYFGRVRDFDKLLVRFRRVGASYVTTSIAQGQNQIVALLKRGQEV